MLNTNGANDIGDIAADKILTRRWKKYTRSLRKFDWLVAIASVVLFAVTINYVRQIKVRSDFKSMLPDKAPSVVNLNRIEERVRGTDNLLVLAGASEWKNLKRFIDDFVKKLNSELASDVQRIEYNVKTMRKFYEDNKYLYIEKNDLREIHDRLKRKIDYEKLKELPFYIDLGEEAPEFSTGDIEDKYKSRTQTYQKYHDDYFTTPDGKIAAIIIWPKEGATNVDFSKKLIAKIRTLAEQMDPKKYDPEMKIAFGGRLRKMIVEYNAVIGDILKTSVLVLLAVGLVVLIYYRRIRMGVLMTVNVAQGTLAALAIAFLSIGYLTSQTAFLGAIIVGNGIDFSLIMMSRYLEERRENKKGVTESMEISLAHTWRPTLTSALTTAAAFFALTMTNIKGFSQFGFIGGIGMPLCWLSTFFFLPAWLSITERVWAIKPAKERAEQKIKVELMSRLSSWIMGHNRNILKFGAALTIASIVFTAWYLPSSLEYNFDKLGFKAPKEEQSWGKYARHQKKNIFGTGSTTPSVVLAEDVKQAQIICDAIEKHDEELGSGYVEKCQTLSSFVPDEQKAKLRTLSKMRHLLSGSTLKFLTPEQLKEVNKFKRSVNLKQITTENLPGEINRMFTDIDGNKGVIAFVYPSADLWNGHELVKFANIIREIKLPSGETIESSGQPVIMADLLRAVVSEGPRVTVLSLLAVMLLVWLNFRRWTDTMLVITSLCTGVILLMGILAIVGIKLNFLNFVALPITFGIGVDYAVNIYQRIKQDNFENMTHSLSKIGGAVIFCSSTTTIGYSVLLTSRSQALVSFGAVALMGEMVCLLVAVFMLPGLIKRLHSNGYMPFPKKARLKDIIRAGTHD